jgi:hypothetical protein
MMPHHLRLAHGDVKITGLELNHSRQEFVDLNRHKQTPLPRSPLNGREMDRSAIRSTSNTSMLPNAETKRDDRRFGWSIIARTPVSSKFGTTNYEYHAEVRPCAPHSAAPSGSHIPSTNINRIEVQMIPALQTK